MRWPKFRINPLYRNCSTNINAEIQKRIPSTTSHKKIHMPIRAVHLGRKMEIVKLFQRLYTDMNKVSHYLHKDSIVLKLRAKQVAKNPYNSFFANFLARENESEENTSSKLLENSTLAEEKWVVYFDYGAVVFFNCEPHLIDKLMDHAQRFCTDTFEIRGHEEELMLVADPMLNKWSILMDHGIQVQKIDHVNVQVIAGVLAQTVALEHYERQVEAILAEFERLNAAVQRDGAYEASFGKKWFGRRKREKEQHHKLFEIVATNNTLLIDLVSKLRVIDRKRPGDVAWDHTRYHSMWETLLEEFELNERFNNLNFKLELIQHNTKVSIVYFCVH